MTSLYDQRYKELMKLFPDGKAEPSAELASIYSYLISKNCRETVARLILAFAMKEVIGDVADNSLLTKIEQQLQGQQSCPTPYCWLRETDEEVIKKHEDTFA